MSFFFQPHQATFNPFFTQGFAIQQPTPFSPFGFASTPYPFMIPQHNHHHHHHHSKAARKAAKKQEKEEIESLPSEEAIIEHRLEQGHDGSIYIRQVRRKLSDEEKAQRAVELKKKQEFEEARAKEYERQREEYLRHVEEYQQKQRELAEQRKTKRIEAEKQQREYLQELFKQMFGFGDDTDEDAGSEEYKSDQDVVDTDKAEEITTTTTKQPTVEEPVSNNDESSDDEDAFFNPFALMFGQHPFVPFCQRRRGAHCKKQKNNVDDNTTPTTTTNKSEEDTQQQQQEIVVHGETVETVIGQDNQPQTKKSTINKKIKVPQGANLWDVVQNALEEAKQEQIEDKTQHDLPQIETKPVEAVVEETKPVVEPVIEPVAVVEEVKPIIEEAIVNEDNTVQDINQDLLTKLYAQTESLYKKRAALVTKIKSADAKKAANLQLSLKQLDKLIEQTHQYTQELLDDDEHELIDSDVLLDNTTQ